MKKGGDVAHKLESLYQFILHQLTLANIKSDREALESIVNVLTPLMEAWKELLAKSNNDGANNGRKNLTAHPHKKIASKCWPDLAHCRSKNFSFAFSFTQTQFFYIHTQHLLVLNADGLFLTSHTSYDKKPDLHTDFFGYRL